MGLTSVFLCLASSEKDWLPAALLPHTETMRQGEGEREREREGGRGMREWEVDEGEWKSKRREPERFWRRRPINVEISPRIWWNGCVLAINGFQLPKGGRGGAKVPHWMTLRRKRGAEAKKRLGKKVIYSTKKIFPVLSKFFLELWNWAQKANSLYTCFFLQIWLRLRQEMREEMIVDLF